MQPVSIKIDDRQVLNSLQELSRRMGNPAAAMKIIGERILLQTEERFNREGPAPDGSPWPPLAASTRRRKKHPKILTESGRLRGRIRYQLLGNSTLVVGSAEPYAAIHQLGGTIHKKARSVQVRHRTDAKGNLLRTDLFGGKGLIFAKGSHRRVLTRQFSAGEHDIRIPARPFLGLSRANSGEITGIITAYLMKRES
jgi:phage virion morphogenesis protein